MIEIAIVDPGIDALRIELAKAPIGPKEAVLAEAERASSVRAFWLASANPAALSWVLARFGADRVAVLRVARVAMEIAVDLLLDADRAALARALATARRVGDEPLADDVLESATRSLLGLTGQDAAEAASISAWGSVSGLLDAAQSWIDDATFVTLVSAVARRGVNARSFVEDDTSPWERAAAEAIRAACTLV